MLQFQSRKLDICQVSKLLAGYNIKASISDRLITLDGEIPDELLTRLCNAISICTVQNYGGEVSPILQANSNLSKANVSLPQPVPSTPVLQTIAHTTMLPSQDMQSYDLIYPTVKRGEVYWCDFGEPYANEQGYVRPAIVVQNDAGNLHSPTTIVLPCTTNVKNKQATHYSFIFSKQNMLNYNSMPIYFHPKPCIVLAEQIRTVSKIRLREYLGTMTPQFMDNLQEIIDCALQLERKDRVITKTETVYVDKPMGKPNEPASSTPANVQRDLNTVQMQLLALIDINEFFKIARSNSFDKVKIEKILTLFGFDMQKNGVQYLFKAILFAPKKGYFNLETLCESISKREPQVQKSEIQRLIVARVKEQFKLKRSPAIDFIRLVNSALIKKEDNQ